MEQKPKELEALCGVAAAIFDWSCSQKDNCPMGSPAWSSPSPVPAVSALPAAGLGCVSPVSVSPEAQRAPCPAGAGLECPGLAGAALEGDPVQPGHLRHNQPSV